MENINKVVFDNNAQSCDIMNHLIKEKIIEKINIADCNPKAQPCVLTNHGINTNVVKFD